MGLNDGKTIGDSQSYNGNLNGSLWGSEYKAWKDAKNGTVGSGSSLNGNRWNTTSAVSSSSSSDRLDWNKMVTDVFNEKKDKK